MDKRSFIKSFSAMGLAIPMIIPKLEHLISTVQDIPSNELATDEAFWAEIRKGYRLKEEYINLENGYYCFLPEETLENYIGHIREINLQGSYYLRTVQWENKQRSADRLAELAGCSPEELIITRNTTESLDLVIAGYPWQEGDEAVMAEQDYGAMLDQFRLMEKRHGIFTKRVSLPNHPKSDQEIVDLYASAITDRTRLLMVCHLVNITGQVLPIRNICEMAHSKGVEVMVDGAHAFAHLDFKIPELQCDYYGTSLHKWLSAPLGAGLLYINREKVQKLSPLFAESDRKPDDISRLNHTGTHPVYTDLAIINAIDYHQKIGIKRKEARLKYLQNYWTSKVRQLPRVLVNSPESMDRHGAIGNVGIEGITPSDLAKRLMDEHHIWTVAIKRVNVEGVRVTPNVYTTIAELDEFVKAIKILSNNV